MLSREVKTQAEAQISPDKGDDRLGISVQINNYKVWMTRTASYELEKALRKARQDADRIERKHS